jgi:pSer/pThr/pTyr-binding forkhead associated (FHA) protein
LLRAAGRRRFALSMDTIETPLAISRASNEDLEARRDAERRGSPFLVYRDDKSTQQIFELDEGMGSLTVGRRFEADLSLPWDPEVSRLHAEFERRAGEWTVCDDGWSQNGTWVNGIRLHGRRRLHDGDLVRIGQTVVAFCSPGLRGSIVTMVPGRLSSSPRFSDQQQHILRALCAPLLGDGEGIEPLSDEAIAETTGVPLPVVIAEIDHLGRSFGLMDMPRPERRAEIALLALRAGLVD